MKHYTYYLSLVGLLLTSSLWAAPPECNIDTSQPPERGLLSMVSGNASGFQPGPVYVTVTNGEKKFTTMADRAGDWAIVYANIDSHSEVLCWQPWRNNYIEAKSSWESR